MTSPRFDPSHNVAFDLERGQIVLRGSPERVLVPADALLALCEGAGPEALVDFGRRVGTDAGRRIAERLQHTASASIEAVVEHLGGELALLGFGSLALERWGRALVFSITGSPFGAGGDAVLGAILEGALQRGFGRDTGVVRLERDAARARFLVTSPSGADRVRELLDGGTSWGDVLTQLDRTATRGAA